jgi:two-component system NtrC family sensor kinase
VEKRISDYGCGISPENISRIFDPFFTAKEIGNGTGLGMNIAYNIIKKHNGTFAVQSEVGNGTTFLIKLPPPRRLRAPTK